MEENKNTSASKNKGAKKRRVGGTISVDKTNHKLIYTNAFGIDEEVGDEIIVKGVTKNLDDNTTTITFGLRTNYQLKKDFVGDLSDLNWSKIQRFLSKNGVLIREEYHKLVAGYLINEVSAFINKYGVKYEHSKLGWIDPTNISKGYLASRSISAAYPSVLKGNDKHEIGPNGNREIYDDMISKEVIANKAMHLPFVLAFTAPLVPLMCGKTGFQVLLANFAGMSSHGKSTSMSLIASVWGKGSINNTRLGVAKTFRSTQNAFALTVSRNNGFPVVFDDYENAPADIRYAELIYDLADGSSKMRCINGGRETAEPFNWSTFIGTTGESSLLDRAEKKMGLTPRIVEFKNISWTISKANSNTICRVTRDHYGFYGEEFIEKLMKKKIGDIEKLYEKCESEFNTLVPPRDNVEERLQQKLGFIKMTAVLVKELMGFEIDVDYITDVMAKNEISRQQEPSIFEEAKEKILEFAISHFGQFIHLNKGMKCKITNESRDIVGRIYSGQQGELIAILPEYVDKIMAPYKDREAIYTRWLDEKFLVNDSGSKFRKNTRINDDLGCVRCYNFLYKDFSDLYSRLTKEEDAEDISMLDQEDFLDLVNKSKKKDFIRVNGEDYVRVPKELGIPKVDARGKVTLHEPIKKQKEEVEEPIPETKVCDDFYYEDDEFIFDSSKDEGEGE